MDVYEDSEQVLDLSLLANSAFKGGFCAKTINTKVLCAYPCTYCLGVVVYDGTESNKRIKE